MVKVLFFANLREVVGTSHLEVDVSAEPSINGLLALLKAQIDPEAHAQLVGESVRIAVNQELIEGNVPLGPHDEVAFLPPVTGG